MRKWQIGNVGDRMELYNNKLTYRINRFIRFKFITPRYKKRLRNRDISILCNNCTGGFVLHDLGIRFNSPTINMFFHGLDFFDFVEHFEYYIQQPLIENKNPNYGSITTTYPVAILNGGEKYRNLELHFLHYSSFEEAKDKWNKRKERLNMNGDNLYLIWSFVGMEKDEKLYQRAQNLPVKNKVIFVNHPVDIEKYPSFFYIKGFENNKGLGIISQYSGFWGKRYYDQFDFVNWINKGKNRGN